MYTLAVEASLSLIVVNFSGDHVGLHEGNWGKVEGNGIH